MKTQSGSKIFALFRQNSIADPRSIFVGWQTNYWRARGAWRRKLLSPNVTRKNDFLFSSSTICSDLHYLNHGAINLLLLYIPLAVSLEFFYFFWHVWCIVCRLIPLGMMFCSSFFHLFWHMSCFVFLIDDSSSASSLSLPFFALRWPLALLDSSNDLLGTSNDAKVAKSFSCSHDLFQFFTFFIQFVFCLHCFLCRVEIAMSNVS